MATKRFPNRYAGRCRSCGRTVPAGEGLTHKGTTGWVTEHETCVPGTPTLTVVKEAPLGDVQNALGFALPEVETVTVDDTPAGDLFTHQAQVVAAVQAGSRSIYLADEPGLGKTATALVSLAAAGSRRAVVVVPAVVKVNWAREAATWLPGAVVQVLAGRKANPIDHATSLVVVNFDILAAWVQTMTAWGVDALIVDEAHYIKDRRSARSTAVEALSGALPTGALRMMLSGTPIPNRPIELAQPLTLLGMLEGLGGFWGYAKRYCDAFEGRYGWDMTGASNLEELHTNLLEAGLVRRRKGDVLDLPDRTVVDVPVELDAAGSRSVKAAQDALATALVEAVREREKETGATLSPAKVEGVVRLALAGGGAAFEQLAALRKAIGVAKAALVIAQTEDLLAAGEQVVVVVHHRDVQTAVADALTEHGVVRITGGQSQDGRQAAIDAFQAGTARVAVCSMQAAGVGITLHAASQVVIGELPWTSAAQEQAIDRVHRIGQDAPVTAWRILAAGTLDERMAALISSKAGIALAAIDGGEAAVGTSELTAAQALTDLVLTALAKPARRSRKKAAAPSTEAVAA